MKFSIWVFAVAVAAALYAKSVSAADDRELGKPTEQPAPTIAPAVPNEEDITYGPNDDDVNAAKEWTKPMTEAELKAYQQTPIYPQFQKVFKKCAPAGCEPLGIRTLFKTGVRGSCLMQGKSLNLGSIKCQENHVTKIYKAIDGGPFEQVIKCIANQKVFRHVKYKTGMDNIMGYRSFALISMGCHPGKDGRPKNR